MNGDTVMRILPVAGLVAVFILLVTWIGRRRKTAPVPLGSQPSGFQGWLALLALAETLTPVRLVGSLGSSLTDLTDDGVNGAFAIVAGVILLLAAYSAFVAVMMWRRSRWFRVLFTWQWGLSTAFTVLSPAAIWLATGQDGPLLSAYDEQSAAVIAQTVIGSVWVVYVWRSERVRNTFALGRGGAATVDPGIFS